LDVAEGLNYLHASYTIHGDLKGVGAHSGSSRETLLTPGQPNILIKSDGHACLADFGLASIVQGNDSIVPTHADGYTARWTAPEILKGANKITREADVFSFGMVVMEVCP
jgi:serine/threonine protein kinase